MKKIMSLNQTEMSDPEHERLFQLIYEKYRYLMLKVAYDVLKDKQLAEDAVHEAFIKAAYNTQKIHIYHSVSPKRYLITITKNTSIDMYRKRQKLLQNEICLSNIPENTDVEYSDIDKDVDDLLYQSIQRLPDKYRDVLLLKFLYGYTNTEITHILNISEGNVRQRIARGKKKLEYLLNHPETKNNA